MRVDAGHAEILRSVQRDRVIQKRLNDSTSQIFSSTLGPLQWMKWRHFLEGGSTFAYQALTTLCNLQTLGEEYTGIIHWTDQQRLPSRYMQVCMVLLNCFGERFILNLVNRLETLLNNLPEDSELRPEAKQVLLTSCLCLKRVIPILALLHQTAFYFQGRYFQLSKRITGIRYRLVRSWLGDHSMSVTFRILGAISFLHLCATVYSTYREISMMKVAESNEVTSSTGAKCSLCLNTRTNTSTTLCGHLFCWECIHAWVQEQPFCPLCRQAVQPSRIIFLQNYKS